MISRSRPSKESWTAENNNSDKVDSGGGGLAKALAFTAFYL